MLEYIQQTPLANVLYYTFHVLGFVCVFIFNAWYGKKREIPIRKSALTTVLVYAATYVWIYIQFWIESGFANFGGNNIVRGFVYIPLIAYPVALLLKINWTKMCDFIAPCVCLSHGVSHIGCIFVGCCEGYPAKWGIYNYRYLDPLVPVQIFEALTALAIFAGLVYFNRRKNYTTDGTSYPIMLILFGFTRFLWEFARYNPKIWLGCSSLSFHALFMAVVGAVALCVIVKKSRKKTLSVKKRRK